MEELERFLVEKVQPVSAELDFDAVQLKHAFSEMGKLKFLGILADKKFGGKAFSLKEYFAFSEMVASYSGALNFLQRQHQSTLRILQWTEKEHLQKRIPAFTSGKRTLGVALAQLRKGTMKGEKTQGGYRVDGTAEWVTGYKIFDEFVLGFSNEGNQDVYVLVPFEETKFLHISDPYDLLAMRSVQTVKVECDGFFASEKDIIAIKPHLFFDRNSFPPARQFANLTGVGKGALRLIESSPNFDKMPKDLYPPLKKKFLATRNLCYEIDIAKTDPKQMIKERHTLVHEVQHLVQLACFLSGSAAILGHHDAQRIYREAMFYSLLNYPMEGMLHYFFK